MSMFQNFISHDKYSGQVSKCNDRFSRDNERLKKVEDAIIGIHQLESTMATSLAENRTEVKQLNSKVDAMENKLNDKVETIGVKISDVSEAIVKLTFLQEEYANDSKTIDKRINKLEVEKSIKYDKFVGWIGSAFVGGIIGYLILVVFN